MGLSPGTGSRGRGNALSRDYEQIKNLKAMELRKKLRNRAEELRASVEKCAADAFEKVFHQRMDTYFTQQERLDELDEMLSQFTVEIDGTDDLAGLQRLAGRLTFLEDHFDEIDSRLFDRPARRRPGRFSLLEFLRQWQNSRSEGGGGLDNGEIRDEDEAFRELGVEPGAPLPAVTRAFRRLIKEMHPDRRNGDRSAEPRLRRLVAAYEFIKKRGAARPH